MTEEEKTAIKTASSALQKDPEGAFAPFYELTKQKVFYLIYSYVRVSEEAEDLLQETYVAFLNNLDKIQAKWNPLSYLLATAEHLAIDALRKRKVELPLDEEGNSEVIGAPDPEIDDSGPLLRQIKAILSPFEFQVYLLHVLDDLTFKEISHRVHRPVGTLTYTYSIAIGKLQKGLDPQWMTNLNKI